MEPFPRNKYSNLLLVLFTQLCPPWENFKFVNLRHKLLNNLLKSLNQMLTNLKFPLGEHNYVNRTSNKLLYLFLGDGSISIYNILNYTV